MPTHHHATAPVDRRALFGADPARGDLRIVQLRPGLAALGIDRGDLLLDKGADLGEQRLYVADPRTQGALHPHYVLTVVVGQGLAVEGSVRIHGHGLCRSGREKREHGAALLP